MCKFNFIIFSFIILLLSCTPSETSDSISDRTVISVGDVAITEYELEKNLKLFQQDFQNKNGRKAHAGAVRQWIDGFIERTYFIADAMGKGYDTMRRITDQVEAMSRFVLAQANGPLEQKMFKQESAFSDEEINVAIERSKKKMHIEYLRFPEYDRALEMIGGKPVIDQQRFELLRKLYQNSREVHYGQTTLVWPFRVFWERAEYLFGLNKNDVAPLMSFNDGQYIIRVTDIEFDTLPPDSAAYRKQITDLLEFSRREMLRYNFMEEVRNAAATRYNIHTVDKIVAILQRNGPVHLFDKTRFNDILNDTLYIYTTSADTENVVLAGNFFDNFNKLIMRTDIRTAGDIIGYIESLVYADYAVDKANELGVTNDRFFLLDRQNYFRQTIFDVYEMEEYKNGDMEVTRQEMENWYASNRESYTQPVDVKASVFSFGNEMDAQTAYGYIVSNLTDSLKKFGDARIEEHITLNYQKERNRQKLVWYAMNIPIGELTTPIPYQNRYYLIRKEEAIGKRIQELSEIESLIEQQIKQDKKRKVKAQRLAELKKTLDADIKIEYEKYLAEN